MCKFNEFNFEETIKKTIKQLKAELQRYKQQLKPEFKTIEDKKQKPVELHQVRKLLTKPSEYILIYHIENTGLVHAIPLTSFVNLVPSLLRIYIRDLTLAPLPFYLYINKQALEKISIPIAVVKSGTVEEVLREVEKTPTISNIKPIKEFVELVWKRYEQLVLASLLYNVIKLEEGLDN
jgi:hypothetical protein